LPVFSTISDLTCPGNISQAASTVTQQLSWNCRRAVSSALRRQQRLLTDVYINNLSNIMNDADLINVDPDNTGEFNVLNILVERSRSSPQCPNDFAAGSVARARHVAAEVEANSSTPVMTTMDQLISNSQPTPTRPSRRTTRAGSP
jgi:hypothetical protein